MPYGISDSQPDCGGWAAVKQHSDGSFETIGCHESKQDAIDQMVAVSISEGIEPLGEVRAVLEFEAREISMVPPEYMQVSARRGLELHEQGYSGDGLMPATVTDARRMAAGEALSESKWRRIGPWIARHIVDLDAVQGDEITPGLVAMLLWGGGSSRSSARRTQAYAEDIVKRLDDEVRYSASQPRAPDGKWTSGGGGAATGDVGSDAPSGGGGTSAPESDIDDDFDFVDDDPGSDELASFVGEELEDQQAEYVDSLDDDQRHAIGVYTSAGYFQTNQALRGAPPPPLDRYAREAALARGAKIDAVIRDAPPLGQELQVYRGVSVTALGVDSAAGVDSLVGGTFRDDGIVSTSLSRRVSSSFATVGNKSQTDQVMLEVLVPSGAKALYVESLSSSPGEYELLLPTGSVFKIGAVRRDPATKTTILSVEVAES